MNLGRLVHSQAYAHMTYTVGVRIWERLLLSLSVIFCFWSSVFLKENKKWRGKYIKKGAPPFGGTLLDDVRKGDSPNRSQS